MMVRKKISYLNKNRFLFNSFGLLLCYWVLFIFPTAHLALSEAKDCDCPQIECDHLCEDQLGLTFYSEKCGSGVRSCSRPTCQIKENPPPSCLDRKSSNKNPTPNGERSPASQKNVGSKAEEKDQFEPAPVVGEVKWIKGTSWIFNSRGQKSEIQLQMKVHRQDKIKTSDDGELIIGFNDSDQSSTTKNELLIQAQTEVVLSEYETDSKKDRKALLDLIKGKIRNKVRMKYKGDSSSYYKIRTKSAVAGVRGTDFLVNFQNDKRHDETKVITFTGQVALGNWNDSKVLEIPQKTEASYVVDSENVSEKNHIQGLSEQEIAEFIDQGHLTPLHHLSSEEFEKWDRETDLNPKISGSSRIKSSQKKSANHSLITQNFICQSPNGDLNQCAWVCENNPSGRSKKTQGFCRSDLPQVRCVRRRCNANGVWAEETHLPKSFFNQCPGVGYRVGSCDY